MTGAKPLIAVVGGAGAVGHGLALRWSGAGYPLIIGSRDAGRAAEAAAAIGAPQVRGMANRAAAAACDICVLAVPHAAQQPTAREIAPALDGKILVDVTVPLVPPRVSRVQLPDGGSAAALLQEMLGERIRVVSAFQNVAAAHLADPGHAIECDVLVCGNDKEARQTVIGLAGAAGMRAWHAGTIANAAAAEALTSVLIFINRAHGLDGSGIRITGEPAAVAS